MLLADPLHRAVRARPRSAAGPPPHGLLAQPNTRDGCPALVGLAPHRCQPTTSLLRAAPARSAQQQQQVLADPAEARPRASIEENNDIGDDDDRSGLEAGPGPRSSGLEATSPEVSFVSLVDGKYTVRGRLLLPVPASRVYSLLTDYGGCQRVFGNIAASEVLRSEDGGLQVIQSCRWKFLAFSGTFRVHLGVCEDPGSGTLLFSLVQSNFMRDFEGRWAVRPADAPGGGDGGGGCEWCEVEHQLSVLPAVPVPAPVSYYTRSIFVRQVEGILVDLQRAVLADAGEEAREQEQEVGVAMAVAAERA